MQLFVPGDSEPVAEQITVGAAGLRSGDRVLGSEPQETLSSHLHLLLQREGYDDVPFTCSPTDSFEQIKKRLQLNPASHTPNPSRPCPS